MPFETSTGTETTPFFPAQPAEPTFTDILGAAFARENVIGSAIVAAREPALESLPDPDFDPWLHIEDTKYEANASLFADTNSVEDVRRVKDRIDREEERARLVYGSTTGTLASIAAGVLDPINLIPIGGSAYRIARTGTALARAAQGAARIGAEAALGQVAQEAGLQATQLTRPLAESAVNVAGAAVLGGVLGGAVGAMRRPLTEVATDLDRETEAFARALDPSVPIAEGGHAGSAAVRGTTLAQETLVGERAMTATRVTQTSPGLRLATDPTVEVRQLSRELIEVPLVTRGHQEGIAEPIAAERLVKMWDAPLATALRDGVESFAHYRLDRARALGDRTRLALRDLVPGTKLTQGQFSEAVGKAMRRADTHSIPEVAESARSYRALFEKLREASVRAGFLDADTKVTTAQSYLPRVPLRERIRARRSTTAAGPGFQDIVTDWLARVHPDIDRLELRDAASEITNSYLGVPSGRTYFPEPIKRGPLKDRTFQIPDVLIEDFLESDIRRVARYAVRTVAPDLALQRRFGTTRAEDVVPRITQAYDRLRRETEDAGRMTPSVSRRLEAQRDAALRDFVAMWETVRGTYGAQLGADIPHGVYAALRDVNAARLLGGMTLAAIPDLARAIGIHGMRAFGPLPHVGTEAYRLAAREAQLAGTALDRVLSTRVAASFDTEDLGLESRLGRALSAPAQHIGTLSGQNLWTEKVKGFVGVVSQNRILEATEKIANERGAPVAQGAPVAPVGLPPVPAGHTRFYHGGVDYKGGTRWLTEDRKYAEGYASKGGGAAKTLYVDVPETWLDANNIGKVFDDTGFETGLSMKSPRVHFDAPEEIARGLKPVLQTTAPAPTTPTVPSRVSKAERTRLASLGIDDEMARRIHSEFAAHGTRHDGLAIARTERWADPEVTEAFRAALAREVDVTIVTPGAGDRPLWMIGRWGNFGKLLGQFQSFVASSMTRVTLAGLQAGDARVAGGFVAMMALGSLSFALKEMAAGRLPPDPSTDEGLRTYVAEGMDRSGIFAWLFSINNISEKMTGGEVGVRALLGAPPGTKYAERNLDNLLLGPSWDLIEQGGRVVGDVAQGEVDQGTVRAMRKMAPLQNLYFLRYALDQVVEGLGDALGLRKSGAR